ncbi:glycosyl transferase group 1 [Microbacterium sp. HM58-2]|nr:glycosyl transferase group 1 [Microbacterium sp. HM58-2]
MRIVHAVASDRFAGVEQFVLRLARAQAEHGDDVTVIGGEPGRMRQPLEAVGVRSIPAARAAQVFREVRRLRADVVNSHMTAADAACALALTGRRGALVSTRHFASRRGRTRMLPVESIIGRRVDAEISVSRAVADAIGVPSTVVHTGVPEATTGSTGALPRIVMVQRLQPEKHTAVGLHAFARSGLADDGWLLDVIGEGPERSALSDLVTGLGLSDSVRFLGFRDDVPAQLDAASILLATCPVEGLGLAVLEAMTHSVAPVAAGAAGHLDLLQDLDSRALFRPDDAADAAEALRAFADDPARRRRLAESARDRARREFSVARQTARTEAVYRSAVERRRR